jgi:hypothetical protein
MCDCGAEILYSFMCTKFSGFVPEGLETMLFQNGCLAFTSSASRNLCLKLKGSVMSASLRQGLVIYRQLQVAHCYYQLVCRPLWLLLKQGESVLHGYEECLFILGSSQSNESDNLE